MLRQIDNLVSICHRKIETNFDNVALLVKPYFEKADDYEYIGPVMVLAPFFAPGFICSILFGLVEGFSLLGSIVIAVIATTVLMTTYILAASK